MQAARRSNKHVFGSRLRALFLSHNENIKIAQAFIPKFNVDVFLPLYWWYVIFYIDCHHTAAAMCVVCLTFGLFASVCVSSVHIVVDSGDKFSIEPKYIDIGTYTYIKVQNIYKRG